MNADHAAARGAVPLADARAVAVQPTRAWILANFSLTQLGWFACVLGASRGWPWLGTALALALLGWHVRRAPRGSLELKLVLATTAIGSSFDAAMQATGSLSFVNGHWLAGLGPHWMTALWALFAMTLNVSMRWLKGRWLLCAALGAVLGPASFTAGARLGAATLAEPMQALVLLGIGWAVVLPLVVWLGQRFDGVVVVPSETGR